MATAQTTAHHASLIGALIIPALMTIMVAPAAIARGFFGWGGE